jgi:hypothetical protein
MLELVMAPLFSRSDVPAAIVERLCIRVSDPLHLDYEAAEDTMMFSPADYVDISSVESRRRAACYAHASQAAL